MSHHAPGRLVILAAIAGGILAVSTASIFIRFAQQQVPSLVIAAYRLSLASLVLAPLALTRHLDELRALTRRDLLLGGLSGFFLALHFATWISSLEHTSVASSVVLVTTTPLWVALASPFFVREPLGRPAALGLLLALAGGVVIGLSDSCSWEAGLACPPLGEFLSGPAAWGNFLALCGAWMAAGYILIGRRLRAGMSLIAYIFVVYGIAAVVLVGLALLSGQALVGYALPAVGWMLALALVPQLLGHSTFNWALGYLPAAFVSVTLLGEPIGSTILAYLLLDERPTPLKIAGGALILVGIFAAAQRIDKQDLQEAAASSE